MVINYQDNNLIVTYLQVYLSEYCGLVVNKIIPRSKKKGVRYEITDSVPLIVTGYYNVQTYTSLAIYMAYNYPNEGFPMKWSKNNKGVWVSEDYVYEGDEEELINVISSNMDLVTQNKQVIQVPERVLSYIFNEVVTPESSPEEILRVKQMILEYIPVNSENRYPLTYTEGLFNTVIDIQKKVINKYTIEYETKYDPITMEYRKDEDGDNILDENNDPIPITRYYIGKQISKVSTETTNNVEGTKMSSTTIKILLVTDNISSAYVLYEEGGQVFRKDASSFAKLNSNQWMLYFDSNLTSEITQITVTYEEPFEYNIITGYIEFFNFVEGKVVTVTETVNKTVSLPEQFANYKITGYVDPWTEIIVKGGYEEHDE